MKELLKKELLLHKIIIKKEDRAMDPDNGITIKILLIDLVPIMGKTTRTVDDHLTDDQINSSTEMMETGLIMEISIVKVELGETIEIFLARHLDMAGTSHKETLSVDFNPFNREIRPFEDQMVTQPIILPLTNKNFRKTTIRHQQTWFASPPLMIVLTNYQNSVR